MRNTVGGTILVAAAVFGVLSLVQWLRYEPVSPIIDAGDPEFGLGERFADIAFTDLDGRGGTFESYSAGRPLLVFVRDALCPVSRRYGPTTARIAGTFGERGVGVLYLNVSPLDTSEDMENDQERYGLPGTYVVDHEWAVAERLRVITTAEVFLFDEDRLLRYRGAIDDQYGIRFTKSAPRETYLTDALEQLLAGSEVARPSTPPEGCYLAADVHDHGAENEEEAVAQH